MPRNPNVIWHVDSRLVWSMPDGNDVHENSTIGFRGKGPAESFVKHKLKYLQHWGYEVEDTHDHPDMSAWSVQFPLSYRAIRSSHDPVWWINTRECPGWQCAHPWQHEDGPQDAIRL